MEEQTSPRGQREQQLWQNIDDSIRLAERHMNLEDVIEDEEEYWDALDGRMHCGVCMVREVMEIVHPAYQQLIDFLSGSEAAGS